MTASWYYEANSAAQGPFTREQMRGLVNAGTLTRETRVWTESLGKWLPAESTTLENLFKKTPSTGDQIPPLAKMEPAPPPVPAASSPGPSVPRASNEPPEGFWSPRLLGYGLTALLAVLTIMTAMEIWSGFQQAELVDRIQQRGSVTRDEARASDARHGIIVTVRLVTFCLTGIVFCCWIYVVAKNVRALGARRLRYSPGAAVGYNFVPIVCLWVPYQAMKEIWKASVDPTHWRSVHTSSVVRWWWGLWVFSIAFNYLLIRIALRAGGGDPAIAARMDIASCFVSIPRDVIAIFLVQMLSEIQVRTATAPAWVPIDSAGR